MIYVCMVVMLLLTLYCFPFVFVIGDSMLPTFRDGQILFSRRVFKFDTLEVSACYVLWEPGNEKRMAIKRLARVSVDSSGKEMCYFLGDNSRVSFDSRSFGWVPRENVIAKVM